MARLLPYPEIGRRLGRERERLGASQEALARAAGVADRTIRRLEAGRAVRLEVLVALGRALELSDGWFLDPEGDAGRAGRAARLDALLVTLLGLEARALVAELVVAEGDAARRARVEAALAGLRPILRRALDRAWEEPGGR